MDMYYAKKIVSNLKLIEQKEGSGLKPISKKGKGLKPIAKGNGCKKVHGQGLVILQ